MERSREITPYLSPCDAQKWRGLWWYRSLHREGRNTSNITVIQSEWFWQVTGTISIGHSSKQISRWRLEGMGNGSRSICSVVLYIWATLHIRKLRTVVLREPAERLGADDHFVDRFRPIGHFLFHSELPLTHPRSNAVLTSTKGAPVGRASDIVGPRPLLSLGTVVFVFSLMMTSISTKYYQFIIFQGLLLGASIALMFVYLINTQTKLSFNESVDSFFPSVTAVSSWFQKYRATALGTVAAGTCLGEWNRECFINTLTIFPLKAVSYLPSR